MCNVKSFRILWTKTTYNLHNTTLKYSFRKLQKKIPTILVDKNNCLNLKKVTAAHNISSFSFGAFLLLAK